MKLLGALAVAAVVATLGATNASASCPTGDDCGIVFNRGGGFRANWVIVQSNVYPGEFNKYCLVHGTVVNTDLSAVIPPVGAPVHVVPGPLAPNNCQGSTQAVTEIDQSN